MRAPSTLMASKKRQSLDSQPVKPPKKIPSYGLSNEQSLKFPRQGPTTSPFKKSAVLGQKKRSHAQSLGSNQQFDFLKNSQIKREEMNKTPEMQMKEYLTQKSTVNASSDKAKTRKMYSYNPSSYLQNNSNTTPIFNQKRLSHDNNQQSSSSKNKENLLQSHSIFSSKRNSAGEAERTKQAVNEKRSIRSQNVSPSMQNSVHLASQLRPGTANSKHKTINNYASANPKQSPLNKETKWRPNTSNKFYSNGVQPSNGDYISTSVSSTLHKKQSYDTSTSVVSRLLESRHGFKKPGSFGQPKKSYSRPGSANKNNQVSSKLTKSKASHNPVAQSLDHQQLLQMYIQSQQEKKEKSQSKKLSLSKTPITNQSSNIYKNQQIGRQNSETQKNLLAKQSLQSSKLPEKQSIKNKFQSAPSSPSRSRQQNSTANSHITEFQMRFIQRNIITKYAFATRVGFVPNNPNKINQDSFILVPNMNNHNFRHYFGVNDGHGQFGKDVSHYVKLRLPVVLQKHITELNEDFPKAAHKSFVQINNELDHTNFDSQLSGTTCCTVLFNGTKIYCANAGDSRAIKVSFENSKNGLNVQSLSTDHKPDLPHEAERILAKGGRIDTFRDHYNHNEPIGPMRVWLKKEELPGLAMSRSLGDKIAQSVGVSPEPEVKEFTLSTQDRFLVIASDGVWEFLSNEEVAKIVLPYFEQNAPEAAANALVKASFKKWKQEEDVIDDITVVIIFLEPSMAYS